MGDFIEIVRHLRSKYGLGRLHAARIAAKACWGK
jgi:hypothetical protein